MAMARTGNGAPRNGNESQNVKERGEGGEAVAGTTMRDDSQRPRCQGRLLKV